MMCPTSRIYRKMPELGVNHNTLIWWLEANKMQIGKVSNHGLRHPHDQCQWKKGHTKLFLHLIIAVGKAMNPVFRRHFSPIFRFITHPWFFSQQMFFKKPMAALLWRSISKWIRPPIEANSFQSVPRTPFTVFCKMNFRSFSNPPLQTVTRTAC